jgi:hypothetical protein
MDHVVAKEPSKNQCNFAQQEHQRNCTHFKVLRLGHAHEPGPALGGTLARRNVEPPVVEPRQVEHKWHKGAPQDRNRQVGQVDFRLRVKDDVGNADHVIRKRAVDRLDPLGVVDPRCHEAVNPQANVQKHKGTKGIAKHPAIHRVSSR